MRIVLDTNVVISAFLLRTSVSRRAFDEAMTGTLLISEETFRELKEVLSRPQFRRYITEEERTLFLNLYLEHARMIVQNAIVDVCRDPTDNKLLELAVSGRATRPCDRRSRSTCA